MNLKLQLPTKIMEYTLRLAFQPPTQYSLSTPIYTLTLEELTSHCLYLTYEFHGKCCACKYWDYFDLGDNQYDF
jgi:hypothetical protein